jgi:hypothetical protein
MANNSENPKSGKTRRTVVSEFEVTGNIQGYNFYQNGIFMQPMGQIVRVEGESVRKVAMGLAGDHVVDYK